MGYARGPLAARRAARPPSPDPSTSAVARRPAGRDRAEEAGGGQTEVAKGLASAHGAELIRLQWYEGLDQSAPLYEWNYQRQLLAIQAHRGQDAAAIEDQIFSEKYLLERPLLAAIR